MNKKTLTKYNIALDVRFLSATQFDEILDLTKDEVIFRLDKSIDTPFLVYSKPCNMVDPDGTMSYRYDKHCHCEGLKLVDYITFKSIHFPCSYIASFLIDKEAQNRIGNFEQNKYGSNEPEKKFKILALLYSPIFFIGGFILGFAIIFKVIGAYLMLSPELAESEISHLKKSLNL